MTVTLQIHYIACYVSFVPVNFPSLTCVSNAYRFLGCRVKTEALVKLKLDLLERG